jgi:DNA-binding NtrC family response regulator
MGHVLIIDDEPAICWGFQRLLTGDGHTVATASSAEEGLELAEVRVPDAVLLDVRLPGIDGLAALKRLRSIAADVPVVLMTAFGSLDTAVRAIESGVVEYLPKPFDLEEAAAIIRRVLEPASTTAAAGTIHAAAAVDEIIGTSRAMQEVFKRIAMAASGDVPVLITGESGTGKELVARAIHRHGRRREGPFVAVSLASLSPTVIESELFGHVRGAFTGAEADRAGMLELADGGTVLLDEIGDVPLETQVKLLRAIERKEVQRVGETRVRAVDFRVVAATNRSLPDLIERQAFREDLYYRLSVFPIALPPLRERREDIPALAMHFLREAAGEDGPAAFSPTAMAELQARRWRGNVRELRNAVEHAALVSRGREIGPPDFPQPLPDAAAPAGLDDRLRLMTRQWAEQVQSAGDDPAGGLHERLLDLVEPELLKSVLEGSRGNRAITAEKLGIHRATLREKLRRYKIVDPEST